MASYEHQAHTLAIARPQHIHTHQSHVADHTTTITLLAVAILTSPCVWLHQDDVIAGLTVGLMVVPQSLA